jgi:hypothetical protein
MSNRRAVLCIVLALGVLAGGLRFFRLGTWAFHGDELPTVEEADYLFQGYERPDLTGIAAEQFGRLPRLIPLSYAVHYLGYCLFGRDELGSRVIIALLGTLNVLLVFLCLDRPLGRVPALATALLVALWPEHLYRSQENRFYMVAAICASLCMMLGAQAVYRRSFLWTALACLAGLAAVYAHTLQGLVFGGLFLAILAAAWLGNNWRLVQMLGVVLAGGLVATAVVVWHVLPLAHGWNAGEEWGFGNWHSVMASVSQLGWPITLLALLGTLTAWKRGTEQDGYWLTWTALWAGCTLLLPVFVVYHPGYVFPLALGVLVLAGRAIAQIYDSLRIQNPAAAYAWLGLAVAMNLPSLVSHFSDGSRYDFRTPARHIVAHWQPGDRIASPSPRLLKHYLGHDLEPIGVKGTNPLPRIQRLTDEPGRLWIVVPSSRDGKPENLRRWLGTHCSQQMALCRKRFDYYEYVIEVYLYDPPPRGPLWTGEPPRRGVEISGWAAREALTRD